MKSIMVIGMGRFGRHLASEMQALGNDIMVVDKDAEKIEELDTVFTDCQIADCTNSAVIRSLGVKDYDICFVAIGDDFQSSLVITSLLKKNGAKYVVAKSKRDIQEEILKQIGADEVVYPEREIAEKLAMRFSADNIFDCVELTSEYAIYEIPILQDWTGKTISAMNIRRKYKINIIAIKNSGNLCPMPGADYVFNSDDHIVVIGKANDVFKLTSKVEA